MTLKECLWMAIISTVAVLFGLLMSSCIKPTPPPMPSAQALELPAPYCASGDAAGIPLGVCNTFTRVGKFACALCPGESKCTDGVDMVYCANTCRDPLCVSASSP